MRKVFITVDKLGLYLQIGFSYISLILSVALLSQFDAITKIDSAITEQVSFALAKVGQKLCI